MNVYLAGDSIAEGLARALEHDGQDVARGRRTSGQGALPVGPDWVVVSLGTNDRPGPALVEDVRTLLETRGGRPVVWLLPPRATREDVAARRPGTVASIREGAAGVRGVLLLEPAVVPLADGVHPTRAGYVQLAAQIQAVLEGRTAGGVGTGSTGGAAVAALVVGGLIAWAITRTLSRS